MFYDAEQDPLCYPGTNVLINRAGLRSQVELDDFELSMFLSRSDEPPPPGRLDQAHYCAIHRHLFQDVYEWAGQPRTIRIGKSQNWFCYPEHIDREMERLFKELAGQGFLRGFQRYDFAVAAAHFLADLNAIHPSREGNGRTQIAFLVLLSRRVGFDFDETALEPARVLEAMIASFNGDEALLAALLFEVVS